MGVQHRDSKKKIYAPFGVAIKRFATIGFHPKLDHGGSMQKTGGLGPGQYNIEFQGCCFKKRSTKESWTRKKEVEEFSQQLGFRNAELLQRRKEALMARGPGTLEISDTLFKPKSHNAKKDIFFGKERRFRTLHKNTNPAPGSYGKNHNPYARIEESRLPKHQWTPVPIFEWDNFIDRFKIGRFQHRDSLPPNTYKNVFQVGIEQSIAKKLTKRGPYDCFTGPRDSTTIKGYFAPSKFTGPKSWPMKLPGEVDRLFHRSKNHYGQFLKCDRFTKNPGTRLMLTDITMCPKNPSDPAPGHYDIEKPRTFKQNMYPYNQSVWYARPNKKWAILPGVGSTMSHPVMGEINENYLCRYNPNLPKCKYKDKGENWFFKSKSKREFYHVEEYNNF